MELAYGGDDVTEFLHDLLKEASFPYKEEDLTKLWDWSIFESMKEKVCNLNEVGYLLLYTSNQITTIERFSCHIA